MLKEKIKNSSLIFIQENAFKKPERSSINQKDKKEMNIFLHELRPSLNGIESFLKKIYEL